LFKPEKKRAVNLLEEKLDRKELQQNINSQKMGVNRLG
jgi:hypothetical protein